MSETLFRKGDRITVAGHRAVVEHVGHTVITVAYRDAWYWRVWWMLGNCWRAAWRVLTTPISFRPTPRKAPFAVPPSTPEEPT